MRHSTGELLARYSYSTLNSIENKVNLWYKDYGDVVKQQTRNTQNVVGFQPVRVQLSPSPPRQINLCRYLTRQAGCFMVKL